MSTSAATLRAIAVRHHDKLVALRKENVTRMAQPSGAEAGNLISFCFDLNEVFRRAAEYVDRILKGAKPADLAVEQSTKFQLIINLKTARALGLTIPQSLLLRADEVIE